MKIKALLVAFLLMCGINLAQTATAQQTAAQPDEISLDQPPADEPQAEDSGWPRELSSHGRLFTIYQPQVESWDKTTLEQRSAVSVRASASATPAFGVIWMKARTDVDKSTRTVRLEDVEIVKGSFPAAKKGEEGELLEALRSELPKTLQPIALDRLEASLGTSGAETPQAAPELRNEPPRILYSSSPAILVPVDGEPALRDTAAPGFKRVVNTRALIVFDEPHVMYYLWLGNRWLRAPSLENGPWHDAQDVQPSVADALARVKAGAQSGVDLLEEQSGRSPRVLVSTQPAELLQTQGSPQYAPVPKTGLLYVKNTGSDLFLNTADQKYYALLSGRWYRSETLTGSWSYVSPKKLPSDFAKIPEKHAKGEVLASVAGTPQAKEAVISNQIPQTATIDKSTEGEAVAYDGPPSFVPIEGTSLRYSPNTPIPVIEVNPSSYYCVQNGIWFDAPTPNGPWHVSTFVPPAIYSIPASSPMYYVTYVYVYRAGPRFVYVGYLPGYLGSYVTPDGVVVYGTGWRYRRWVGAAWYGAPVTYGFGVTWGLGFGWSLHVGAFAGYWGGSCVRPWWGPYRWYEHGWPRGPVSTVNININRANVYRHWHPGVVHSTWARHDVRGFERGTRIVSPSSRPARPNNLFSDRQGNVYRHSGQGWERYGHGGWQRAPSQQRPAGSGRVGAAPAPGGSHGSGGLSGVRKSAPQPTTHGLERERQARERGEQRVQQWRSGRQGSFRRPGRR